MEKNSEKLSRLLSEFWSWSGISRIDYYSSLVRVPIEEFYFPQYDNLIKTTFSLINTKSIIDNDLDMILEVMALDNEGEIVLDFIENTHDLAYIEKIAVRAVNSTIYDIRWQISELLGRIKSNFNKKLLIMLMSDSDNYVKRRALLSLNRLDNKLAAIEAQKISDNNDDMLAKVIREILNV